MLRAPRRLRGAPEAKFGDSRCQVLSHTAARCAAACCAAALAPRDLPAGHIEMPQRVHARRRVVSLASFGMCPALRLAAGRECARVDCEAW